MFTNVTFEGFTMYIVQTYEWKTHHQEEQIRFSEITQRGKSTNGGYKKHLLLPDTHTYKRVSQGKEY